MKANNTIHNKLLVLGAGMAIVGSTIWGAKNVYIRATLAEKQSLVHLIAQKFDVPEADVQTVFEK